MKISEYVDLCILKILLSLYNLKTYRGTIIL